MWKCEFGVSSEKGVSKMKEIEKARNQLIIPVSYVSVTNSTQATSPWAGSLEQEECVLSLMTL